MWVSFQGFDRHSMSSFRETLRCVHMCATEIHAAYALQTFHSIHLFISQACVKSLAEDLCSPCMLASDDICFLT